MNKFDRLYNKIISECKKTLFNNKLDIDHMFAPKVPFQITEDMIIDQGFAFEDSGNWAGKVVEILSNDEIIYEVCGKYIENLKTIPGVSEWVCSNFLTIKCKPFKIKYKLTPGESYYICDKIDPHCKWLEVTFTETNNDLNDINLEDGECCDARFRY